MFVDKIIYRMGLLIERLVTRYRVYQHHLLCKRFQSLGIGGRISRTCEIHSPESVSIGNNVFIGANCFIFAVGGLRIDDHAHLSRNITIYCSDHDFETESTMPYGPARKWSRVHIKEGAWIGMNAMILPGVTIGRGAIVGMGAIVTKDVADGEIVASPSARPISARSERSLNGSTFLGGPSGRPLLPVDLTRIDQASAREADLQMVFVLTTGRSGSNAISTLLRQPREAVALHEPRPQFISLSSSLEYGDISEDQITEEIRRTFKGLKIAGGERVYVESDQKYFNLVRPLRAVFPKSKFIWLARDGRAVVASTYKRGWYGEYLTTAHSDVPYMYEQHRLQGDKLNVGAISEWSSWSPFAKNCWYWAYVNSRIGDQLLDIPPEDQITLKLEELSDRKEGLGEFLGIDMSGARLQKTNRSAHGKPSSKFSEEEEAIFERLAGPIMERLGYL